MYIVLIHEDNKQTVRLLADILLHIVNYNVMYIISIQEDNSNIFEDNKQTGRLLADILPYTT